MEAFAKRPRGARAAAQDAAKARFLRKPGVIHGVPGADDPSFQGMLRQAVENHVESFNDFLENGLTQLVQNLSHLQVDPEDKADPSMIVRLTDLKVMPPVLNSDPSSSERGQKLMPRDCRLAHLTYGGKLMGKFQLTIGSDSCTVEVGLGEMPIMVRSLKCNLYALPPRELVARGEDETEAGGYFLIHGLERVIRMLIMPRCNYPMAICRPSYKSRGALYTKYAVLMRCMRSDGTTQTNTLHYTSDGSAYIRFSYSKEEWLIPLIVVLHACCPMTDQQLGELLAGPPSAAKAGKQGASVDGGHNDDIWTCVLVMMQQQNAKQPISGHSEARRYLGKTFRVVLGGVVPRRYTDEQVGEFIIKKLIMVHVENPQHKLLNLVVMFQKLMALVTGSVDADSQDTMCNHDVLLPGNLFASVMKENLEKLLNNLKIVLMKVLKKDETGKKKHSVDDFRSNATLFQKYMKMAGTVGKALESFISTGNISSKSGLDLMQVSGYTVVADKLNQARFSSHFAAVHRGQYFAEMKTTTVRKLLPETWGFLCPVHTPDGSPCGLLNHLAATARAVVRWPAKGAGAAVTALLASLGLHVFEAASKFAPMPRFNRTKHAWVLLDGIILGFVEYTRLTHVEEKLRDCKVRSAMGVPPELEIVCIAKRSGRIYPGLFLFLGPGRLVRAVTSLNTGKVEMIGALEQLFLNISVLPEERKRAHAMLEDQHGRDAGEKSEELPEQLPLKFSHEELEPTRMLSLLAALTPFSNHNQSPRNMYQCQMLKQTMGTPYHNHVYRTDNKVFRILHPQKPMTRTQMYDKSNCDLHPTGTNAVVAVITYTGYDMEDAMLINKASYDRGFAHGAVYKTKIIDAASTRMSYDQMKRCHFGNVTAGQGKALKRASDALDDDGFPPIGTYLRKGDPMYCVIDHTGKAKVETYHDEEPAYVEQATLVDGQTLDTSNPTQRLMLKLRYQRNPVVGDKFASRHGQKGVMSLLWPQEDMPFTESGITPDILFNPHGFPSRMTIGMLIESIAGKAAASDGLMRADATTFRGYKGRYDDPENNNESDPFLQRDGGTAEADGSSAVGGLKVADYFGSVLKKHGFQKLGTERMYSGIHGTELETEIFVGVIYYQRLRHLVMDKAQARSRGPNDRITNQPVKGRKRGGGIRFGEMERDSLIAHGAAYLLHDRLFRCSDFDTAYVCPMCGSILTPQANAQNQTKSIARDEQTMPGEPWECPPCSKKAKRPVRCQPIPIPWVFRYLVCELASMNVRINVRVAERGRQTSLACVDSDPAEGEGPM